MTARRAAAILQELKCPFVLNQVRYSIFDRHIEPDDLEQAAADAGFGIICFSPLAQRALDKQTPSTAYRKTAALERRPVSSARTTHQGKAGANPRAQRNCARPRAILSELR
ncbi:MAG: aldo/keto reductase [Eubacteriales bacterium]